MRVRIIRGSAASIQGVAMTGDRVKVAVAVSVVCGCAFAGGLLAQNAASEKAVVGGALVAIGGLAFAAVVRLARRISARTPDRSLQQTGGA
jgi:hypothetical protein